MKTCGKYAISTQWGSGMHYFNGYTDDQKAAMLSAEGCSIGVSARTSKRGARPTVRVWKLIKEYPYKPNTNN